MIKSLIFFDIEGTGRPEDSGINTRITELSLISVSCDHIIRSFKDNSGGKSFLLPRVLQKLTLAFNPGWDIAPNTVMSTGLRNELLGEFQPFDEFTCAQIKLFIRKSPQPTCLIAHNGYRYDFPLLKAHLNKFQQNLPENVLCSDTLHAFQEFEIFDKTINPLAPSWEITLNKMFRNLMKQENIFDSSLNQIMNEIEEAYQSRRQPQTDNFLCSDTFNPLRELEILEMAINSPYTLQDVPLPIRCNEEENIFDLLINQKLNEIEGTYQEKKQGFQNISNHQIMMTPPSRSYSISLKPSKKQPESDHQLATSKARRKLFPDNQKPITYIASLRPSFTLSNIHQHIFKEKSKVSHTAESDSYTLLKCIVAVGPVFLEWVNKNCNHRKFSSITRTW